MSHIPRSFGSLTILYIPELDPTSILPVSSHLYETVVSLISFFAIKITCQAYNHNLQDSCQEHAHAYDRQLSLVAHKQLL